MHALVVLALQDIDMPRSTHNLGGLALRHEVHTRLPVKPVVLKQNRSAGSV
jgi:hypothetical protein